MGVLTACMPMYMCIQCPGSSEEAVGCSRPGVTESCEPCWC